jgi:hypothetical protein
MSSPVERRNAFGVQVDPTGAPVTWTKSWLPFDSSCHKKGVLLGLGLGDRVGDGKAAGVRLDWAAVAVAALESLGLGPDPVLADPPQAAPRNTNAHKPAMLPPGPFTSMPNRRRRASRKPHLPGATR